MTHFVGGAPLYDDGFVLVHESGGVQYWLLESTAWGIVVPLFVIKETVA